MENKNVKTIDINALEYFDKINGNSYFAATVTINYGLADAFSFVLPFQYGYGNQYEQEATHELYERGFLPEIKVFSSGIIDSLSKYCREHAIILRTSKKENCKKRELKNLSA